jgi:salicylate hydroxylase
MARTPRIAIIGGGIGGLAAGLAMQRRGLEVIVCEQSPEISDIGAGLNLSPNALKTFRALGIEEEAIALGHESDYQLVRSWRSGRVIWRQPLKGVYMDRFGAGHLTIHRADLLNVLGRALPERNLRLSARCIGVESDGAIARARFVDGSEIEADLIVGADGIHSVVRTSLFGPEKPRFTGCICWRGLVPREAVPARDFTTDGTSWWGPHGHVVHYLVRRGELVNFVAHIDSDAWTEESWTHECDRAELMTTYARWHESLLRLFELGNRYYKWALYDRDPLPSWSRGRATLLGDSAHAMLPYMGQGACMAVEDGYILSEAIARMPDDIAGALKRYEALRLPRATRAVLGSRQRALENHLSSPFARFRRDMKMMVRDRLGTGKTMLQAEWLYEYDVAAENRFTA